MGRRVWEALIERGEAFGIAPYGTEAMHVLRAEKGFIIVGQETDGTVTPDDIGLAGLVAKSKSDFVGRRSLARPDLVSPRRKQLVGLLTGDARTVLDEGAQIVADPAQPIADAHAWATSPRAIGAPIATARSRWRSSRRGGPSSAEGIYATTPAGFTEVRVCKPVFFDPKGERVHG